MSLSRFALRNRYTVWASTIAVLGFGGWAYLTLPIQLFPETAPPLVNILTPYPGAIARDVADLVSEPIEEECGSLEGLHEISSTSQDGLSLVSVEFTYGTSVDLAAVDVQNAISRIRSRLPREIGEPQVLKFSTSDRPVMTAGIVGSDLVEARRLADDVLAAEMQRVEGVAVVDVFGGHEPEITVSVDRTKLEAWNLDIGDVLDALRAYNASAPAGQIRSRGRQHSFRVDEQGRTAKDLATIPLRTPAGGRVRIEDVAEITDGAAEDASRYHVDGAPAIALQVFKQDDANTVAVVERAREALSGFRDRYPELEFIVAEESASFTSQVVGNMLGSVLQALVLATVVIFLFLGSARRGLVVAFSMPLSFLLTFAVMKILGIGLDLVTLTAVILAVGMVVDSSVVVLENITRRHQEDGLAAEDAAREGAAEIQFAVVAGNLTTITVLVPLLFLYGFVGKTFGPLAATLLIAFLSSLLVALTIVPVLTIPATRDGGRIEGTARRIAAPWARLMEKLRDLYLRLLDRSLGHRTWVFGIALVLLLAGVVLLKNLGMELLPKMDGGATFVTVETPPGSSLDETESVVRAVEELILQEPEVARVSTQIGFEAGMHSFGSGGVQGPTQGYLSITWTPRTERGESIWEIQDRLRDRLSEVPGIRTLVVRESGSTAKSTTASSIMVGIHGPDPVVLDRLGDDLLARVRGVDGVTNPYRSWRIDQRSMALSVDRERAHELGLPPAALAEVLSRSLDGQVVGVLRDRSGVDTPIRARYAAAYRGTEGDALDVRAVTSDEARTVPADAVADASEVRLQGLVTRRNLEPTLDILALHQGRPLSFVSADVASAVGDYGVPKGYEVRLEGENRDMAESRNELMGALAVSFLAVYLLLVAQFRSFLHPVTVLLAVPLGLIGVSVGLSLAGKPVSMPVMVALVLLLGIVINNSIILIDFIRQRREGGMERRAAVRDAVGARFRPILMTSLSTIVGMTPLALEWALGAERFSPLAIAVIGGMTASTFLTLIVIPVAFDAFDDWGMRLSRSVRFGKRTVAAGRKV